MSKSGRRDCPQVTCSCPFMVSCHDSFRDPTLLFGPHFVIGLALVGCGAWINLEADSILRSLRRPGEKGYKIPYVSLHSQLVLGTMINSPFSFHLCQGGPYRYISAPNYAGELLEWIGFATMTGFAPPALLFVVWTAANLFPRALRYHIWYHDKFGTDYPADRTAIVPFLL